MKPELFIRVNFDHEIGLGHLVRCMALAEMLKKYFNIHFFYLDGTTPGSTYLAGSGFSFSRINNEAEFIEKLTSEVIVVLDGYHFHIDYQWQIKSKGCLLVCIDDVHDQDFAADLIINHAPGIFKEDYNAPFYTQFALGPDYVLLRQPFLLAARKKEEEKKRKEVNDTVMICFGGADPLNITEKALATVIKFEQLKKIIVVVGGLYQYADSLDKYLKTDTRIEWHANLSDIAMAAIMMRSDIAIVQASGILFESLASGCIAVTGVYIDNQKFVYSNFVNSNAAYGAQDFSELPLSKALVSAINNTTGEHFSLIDGYSDERLGKMFRQLAFSGKIRVERATTADTDITFKWATDPRVRNFSFNRNTISYEEHTTWLRSKFEDAYCVYLIAKLDTDHIGSIRFDYKEDTQVISYLVDPAFQGQGLGQVLLLAGIKYMMKNVPGKKLHFTGYVVADNIPSLKAFRKLSFTESKVDGNYKFELAV